MGAVPLHEALAVQPGPVALTPPTPCASQVGAGKCVWADGFAMETVANHYRLLCAARAVPRSRSLPPSRHLPCPPTLTHVFP